MNASRIAIYLPSLEGGGAERAMANLASGLASRGLDVDLLLPSAEGPHFSLLSPKVRVIDLKTKKVTTSLPALVRYLNGEKPIALISALFHASLMSLWAKRLARTPVRVIMNLQNTISPSARHAKGRAKLIHPLLRQASRWADDIVAVSDGVADDFAAFSGLPRSRIITIYNPIISPELFERAKEPLDHPWFGPGQPPVIVAIGRLTEQKDFPGLIRALALLRERQEARLLILGEGHERPRLEALVKGLGLDEAASLPGFVANPYSYLDRAAAFALSSIYEGLPTVVVEALALGVPIVATDCRSGPKEILAHGKYGALVPVGDTGAMAEALAEAIRWPRACDEQAWRKYTLESVLDAYSRLLERAHAA
jgi:glycosyltransferase involved in cell wall biosynthesis